MNFFPKKARHRRVFLVLGLLRFLDDRLRSVAGHYPACRAGHDGFILKPQESEIVYALRKIGLDDDVSRNHRTRDIRIVGPIVAVRHRLWDRADSSYIRSAGYRVRAENVFDGAKCEMGPHEIRKSFVQKIHPDGHVPPRPRPAPTAEARG